MKQTPEQQTTIPQAPCRTEFQEEGAAAFSGKLNHKNSRYYVFNDYYNMVQNEITKSKVAFMSCIPTAIS